MRTKYKLLLKTLHVPILVFLSSNSSETPHKFLEVSKLVQKLSMGSVVGAKLVYWGVVKKTSPVIGLLRLDPKHADGILRDDAWELGYIRDYYNR